ncbi:hypothetical protein ACDX78_22645 [Virgibacillus oceani]
MSNKNESKKNEQEENTEGNFLITDRSNLFAFYVIITFILTLLTSVGLFKLKKENEEEINEE